MRPLSKFGIGLFFMFKNTYICTRCSIKNLMFNPECGIRPKTGSFSENEYEKRRTGDNPNQS